MWIVYAMLSAVFAALTSVLAKIGIENVSSSLATAIRTVVIVILAWLVLNEPFTVKTALGALLITAGTLVLTC